MTVPPLQGIPAGVACVADYETLARERLDAQAWAYLAGSAADGVTARRNREAFDGISLRPRILRDVRGGGTGLSLLGRAYAHPVVLAPVAFQMLFHPEGERATAMAAEAMDAVMVASTLSSVSMEAIAEAGGSGPRWFQLYGQPDRQLTLDLAARAEAAGYEAIVLTVDAPITGIRNAEQRAGFRLPPHVRAANFADGRVPSPPTREGHPVFDGLMGTAPTWDDVARVIEAATLPVLLKGVLHPEDAALAIAAGAAGVIVSNHGGRTLDTAMPAIEALPAIATAVAGRGAVLLDGGIRRGTDILKARALGADAVLIGRAYAMALAAAGPLGVAHAIKILVEELAAVMALCGCRTLGEVGPDILVR